MSLADAPPLQIAVFQAVETAISGQGITVVDHVLTDPPDEHIRIEGFNLNDRSYKADEQAEHGFMIQFFNQSKGNARTWTIMNLIHAQILAIRLNDRSPRHRYTEVEPQADGAYVHGMSRYTIIL